jgi:hypothetical protein
MTLVSITPSSEMLLTMTSAHTPATDLGFLLHKSPARFHTEERSFGKVRVAAVVERSVIFRPVARLFFVAACVAGFRCTGCAAQSDRLRRTCCMPS